MKKSILKWAGGKKQIFPELEKHFCSGERFIEPFVGSGVVFLNTNYPEYIINDINSDLYYLYFHIKYNLDEFVDQVKQCFIDSSKDSFYNKREIFNQLKQDDILKSALFVFLNKNCFNGLCRYNKSGKFNVPYCDYKKKQTPPIVNIIDMHNKLQKCTIKNVDFTEIINQSKSGDIVYCDPPYLPLNEITHTSYHKDGFSFEQHVELSNCCLKASERGVKVILSNHDTKEIRKIYKNCSFQKIEVRRSISANKNRNKVSELIVVWN